MGNNGVKGIVLVALLVIVSLIIGSQISSDRLVSFGLVAAMVGAFVLLYLGKNAWWLIFLAPPVMDVLPLPKVSRTDWALLISPAILGYWLLMWIMGYVKIKWNYLWFLDWMVLILFLYTCISYYRHPVAFVALGLDIDAVGGKEYVIAILGILSYIAVSCLPITFEQTKKLLKYLFFTTLAFAIIEVFLRAATGRVASFGDETELAAAATNSRFILFDNIGALTACYLYAYTPFIKLLTNPLRLFGILLGSCGVLISGWRGHIIALCFRFAFIAALKREISVLIILAAFSYAGLLLLSNEQLLERLPFGMQRALCAVPNLRVNASIQKGAQASSDWRVTMWKWALDPRTGYIRDYVWGDGFGQSKADLKRTTTATMRGMLNDGDQRSFASRGVWHSGWITTMHRLGIVGLVVVVILQLQTIFLVMTLGRGYKRLGIKYFSWFCTLFISMCSYAIQYHLSTGTPSVIYNGLYSLACIKVLYCCARDEGLLLPFIRTGPYVPLAIQDIEHTGPIAEAK